MFYSLKSGHQSLYEAKPFSRSLLPHSENPYHCTTEKVLTQPIRESTQRFLFYPPCYSLSLSLSHTHTHSPPFAQASFSLLFSVPRSLSLVQSVISFWFAREIAKLSGGMSSSVSVGGRAEGRRILCIRALFFTGGDTLSHGGSDPLSSMTHRT